MNKEQFTEYMQHPDRLKEASLSDLMNLVKDFPYCQSARILLTMKLYVDKNVLYDAELKTTAIYAGSRNILKKHIDRLNHSSVRIVLPDEEIKQKADEQVQSKVQAQSKAQEAKLHPSHDEKVVEDSAAESEQTANREVDKKDHPEELRSYTVEELKKMIEDRIREIEAEKKQQKKSKAKPTQAKSKQAIIDNFIKNEPSISRPKTTFYDPVDYAKQSVVDQENIVSETLANIYMDQGHFDKAIKIYQKLILKFPEKSTYFAALIEKAEKNLKN